MILFCIIYSLIKIYIFTCKKVKKMNFSGNASLGKIRQQMKDVE